MAQTVSTPDFQNLSLDQIIDANFDLVEGFWRAIKVFLVAYAGYQDFCHQLYTQKFNEYFDAMKELYGFPNPDMNDMALLINEVNAQMVDTVVGIKRVRGHFMVSNLRVVLTVGNDVSNEFPLNMHSEEQNHRVRKRFTFANHTQNKIANEQIRYRLVADDWWNDQEQLLEFSIGYREISAEGFEDWFYFGRGVYMLIKIEIKVGIEPNADPIWISKFHLHTLYFMLVRRYLHLNGLRSTIDKLHRPTANKCKMSYIRKRVDPTSQMAFWSTSRSLQDIMQQIRTQIVETGGNYSQIGEILDKTIKYVDLQISLYFEDEYENITVCLCSEWCNWNAFFHFNPIFRALMVNHNQLYIRDKTNIADIYLFSATILIHIVAVQQQQGQPLDKAPVLQLISCANEVRKLNYNRYFLKIQSWGQNYINSSPAYELLNGMAYKILRESTIIPEIVLQSSTDPFADICLENIVNYYLVLSDLHTLISQINWFVPQQLLLEWFEELDSMSREDYAIYFAMSYQIKMNDERPGYDFLFSEDYEYSKVFVRTVDQKQIKENRDKVYKFFEPENPLNIKITLGPLAATFLSIDKLIKKVDPMLPSIEAEKSITDMCQLCQEIDNSFHTYSATQTLDFFTDLEEMTTALAQKQLFKHYYVFYTLKLYSMAFGVQKYCINALIRNNEETSNQRLQVCPEFQFIWDYSTIENKFRRFYHDQLFNFPLDIQLYIDDFYDSFWGKAAHEVSAATNPNVDLLQCIDSGYFQYQRLYFWWRNGGDTKLKFRRIIDVFEENLVAIADRTNEIHFTYIMDSIASIEEYEYHLEVFDVLVYYLTQAYCSMVFNLISSFLKPLHSLQVSQLVDDDQSYTLTKPGWVLLFRTMHQTMQQLDQMKQHFVVYDDENERISAAISQTKSLIKSIYKHFYQKLLTEWRLEMAKIWPLNPPYQRATYFLPLHLAVGLSFLSAFIDDFRFNAQFNRKSCLMYLTVLPNPALNQQVAFHASAIGCRLFLRNQNAIRAAQPFLETMWRALFNALFRLFDQNTALQLNLDMNEADHSI